MTVALTASMPCPSLFEMWLSRIRQRVDAHAASCVSSDRRANEGGVNGRVDGEAGVGAGHSGDRAVADVQPPRHDAPDDVDAGDIELRPQVVDFPVAAADRQRRLDARRPSVGNVLHCDPRRL
ncbi:MAG TPA: hypothetical protein VEC57_11930 [Candidatus Limnocylindrales bacterium]|nr:hypothetical protein [Candidatus Limnocylindrales bacterium]